MRPESGWKLSSGSSLVILHWMAYPMGCWMSSCAGKSPSHGENLTAETSCCCWVSLLTDHQNTLMGLDMQLLAKLCFTKGLTCKLNLFVGTKADPPLMQHIECMLCIAALCAPACSPAWRGPGLPARRRQRCGSGLAPGPPL